jgi:AraC-like DNA-binding protein
MGVFVLLGATTLSSLVLVLVKAMESYGLDVPAHFRGLGLDFDLLQDPGARFPDEAIIQLWGMLIRESRDPCIGLRMAEFWHPTTLHALGFAWMASGTLQEAFERLVRYNRFLSHNQDYEFRETGKDFRFILHRAREPYDFPDEDYDASFSVLMTLCQEIYGEDFAPLRVDLVRQAPDCAERFRERFSAPVVFGAEHNVFYMGREAVLKPLPAANAELARVNEEVVCSYLEQAGQGALSRRVKTRLVEQLPSGRVSQESIASALHMSARTLQRRLQEEGASYKQLLTETRQELATRYMTQSSSQVSEVAYLLGFSEVGNFTRAFKRWTGVAPSEYRSTH